jgi:hypothetical protein
MAGLTENAQTLQQPCCVGVSFPRCHPLLPHYMRVSDKWGNIVITVTAVLSSNERIAVKPTRGGGVWLSQGCRLLLVGLEVVLVIHFSNKAVLLPRTPFGRANKGYNPVSRQLLILQQSTRKGDTSVWVSLWPLSWTGFVVADRRLGLLKRTTVMPLLLHSPCLLADGHSLRSRHVICTRRCVCNWRVAVSK